MFNCFSITSSPIYPFFRLILRSRVWLVIAALGTRRRDGGEREWRLGKRREREWHDTGDLERQNDGRGYRGRPIAETVQSADGDLHANTSSGTAARTVMCETSLAS